MKPLQLHAFFFVPTQYAELGYLRLGRKWGVVDTATRTVLGPPCRSRLAVLTKIEQLANDRGLTPTPPT